MDDPQDNLQAFLRWFQPLWWRREGVRAAYLDYLATFAPPPADPGTVRQALEEIAQQRKEPFYGTPTVVPPQD